MTLFRISVLLFLALALYRQLILHPEIQEMGRRLHLPELEGTAHQKTIQFAYDRLQKLSRRLVRMILGLGVVSTALAVRSLWVSE